MHRERQSIGSVSRCTERNTARSPHTHWIWQRRLGAASARERCGTWCRASPARHSIAAPARVVLSHSGLHTQRRPQQPALLLLRAPAAMAIGRPSLVRPQPTPLTRLPRAVMYSRWDRLQDAATRRLRYHKAGQSPPLQAPMTGCRRPLKAPLSRTRGPPAHTPPGRPVPGCGGRAGTG